MELKKLSKVKPGTTLVVFGTEREIVEVVNYRGTTSDWINLVSLAETGREVVLEIADSQVRVYLEIQELPLDAETMKPIDDINADVIVIHGSRRFELDEGPSRAKTTSLTKKGTEEGKLKFAVFCPEGEEESDEVVSIENKKGRLIAYHSTGFVPLKEIRVK